MATVFTHAIVGAAIAGGSGARGERLRLYLAGAALAVLPDLDVVAFRLGIPHAHPLGPWRHVEPIRSIGQGEAPWVP